MGGDSSSDCHGFESQHRILNGDFVTFICLFEKTKINKNKNQWKRCRRWCIWKHFNFSVCQNRIMTLLYFFVSNETFLCWDIFAQHHVWVEVKTFKCWTTIITSVTRLSDYWKLLASIFFTKVAEIFGNFLGYCEKHYFVSRNCCGYLLAIVWKMWATFYSNIWSHWS